MKKTIKSYFLFLLSITTMALGITFVTKSNLGTSAISSIQYILSLAFKPSFGLFTFLINLIFFLMQVLILRKEFPKNQYLQLFVGPAMGVFIDIWMNLFDFINPINYKSKLVISVLGCVIIAISTILQLKAGVVTNPAEGIVKTLAYKTKIEFGRIKIYFDLFLVLIASILSFLLIGEIKGIGVGTLITATLVGIIIRIINKIENKLLKKVN